MKWWTGLVAGAAVLMTGCAQVDYYFQAAQGQFALLSGARPIDDWLADPEVGDKLKARLNKVREIRRYAARELGLPDNNSYTNYADLKRPYVLWNVVATPELSMQPAQWCFPIAGCVNYRGYYNKQEALDYADVLRRAGYDVQMSGVAAYSTLGWFNDPVLSTFIQYPDGELARLVFHELAHQVAYAKGDTQFNESFATTVEEIGVERWMAKEGDAAMRENYLVFDGRKRDFLGLLVKYRRSLEINYARQVSDGDKRREKQRIFKSLKADYQVLKTAWGGYAGYDRWFAEPLTNAHLASVATYHDYVPAFRSLMTEQKSLTKFYGATRSMAALEPIQRKQQLALLTRNAALALADTGIKR
ncbi:aminopeptidase [Actimicrobium antarcticum]|uniref:Aminopeptidase n=1 Tax=Actimicrobium antarcticum TaxID=1051899 RepID=A0ABP7SNK3_9BURK